ncbi:hypothetical protein HZC31_03515 [Candidatus Woesearchaeota archaeon]|nr:hypothetical protein [Candidatus Woesearchaeota archaeon]
MKGYEIFIFGMFGAGLGILVGVAHHSINMGLLLLGLAFVMGIAPQLKKRFDSSPA